MNKECEIKLKGGIVIKAGKTEYVVHIIQGNKVMGLTRTPIEAMLRSNNSRWDMNDKIIEFLHEEE